MFDEYLNVTKLDITRFNTSSVRDMSDMFSGCNCLTSLDLSIINIRSVTNMNNLLDKCIGLTFLDLSGFLQDIKHN